MNQSVIYPTFCLIDSYLDFDLLFVTHKNLFSCYITIAITGPDDDSMEAMEATSKSVHLNTNTNNEDQDQVVDSNSPPRPTRTPETNPSPLILP